jgi:hypothetical protein
MGKGLLPALLLASALPAGHAFSQRAYWTGKSKHALSVTSRAAIRRQYNAAGTIFWRTFLGTSCPGKTEVE